MLHYPRSEEARIAELIGRLQEVYHVNTNDIQIVRAPLRICPLGAHIDHQLGCVTGMTINQSLLMAFVPTDDHTVRIQSLNFAGEISFHLDQIPAYQYGDWGNYVRGAALALQSEYPLERGLIGVIGGDAPAGSGGLSSSAATTVSYLMALQAVNQLEVSPRQNIDFSSKTERGYIGLNNGILDQTSVLFGKEHHLTYIDCQDTLIEQLPDASSQNEQTDDFGILIINSGVTDVLVGTGYNNRVSECREAARLLLDYAGENSVAEEQILLRHVSPAIFESEGHRLPDVIRRRATHYFGEMARVQAGREAWCKGDIQRFGELVTASGYSSVHYYECGCPQLITLYELLSNTPGVYGTRFSGAGFRGNYLALIAPDARDEIADIVHNHYPQAHPEIAELYGLYYCEQAGPAMVLDAF
ncbi:MAG: galactokinase family protein [Chloroflexota bacterium]